MLDLNYVRDNLEKVYQALESRKANDEAFSCWNRFA